MYEWERDALGINTLGELKGGVRVRARVAQPVDDASSWWISAVYAPEIWRIWRVGLLRRPIKLSLSETLVLPDALELGPPDDLPPDVHHQITGSLSARVCPVVVAGAALGFLISRSPEGDTGADGRGQPCCDVYAPTGLRTRLGLNVDQEIWLQVLPAGEHHPELRRQAERGD